MPFFFFLVAPKQLYQNACTSVRLSVRLSVGFENLEIKCMVEDGSRMEKEMIKSKVEVS